MKTILIIIMILTVLLFGCTNIETPDSEENNILEEDFFEDLIVIEEDLEIDGIITDNEIDYNLLDQLDENYEIDIGEMI